MLTCSLCLVKSNCAFFTTNDDIRDKILKHLSIVTSLTALICKNCLENLQNFTKFYDRIHECQEQQKLKDVRYIIVLKETTSDPQFEESSPQPTFVESCAPVVPEEIKVVVPPETVTASPNVPGVNPEYFPKVLIENGKLVVKGRELSRLIAKFYKLECTLCPVKKKFRKFSAMSNHFKNEHPGTDGYVECCDQKLSNSKKIAMHMIRHLQPEAFTCHLCKKQLTCPKILRYHIQNHLPENERSYSCPENDCNRKFSYQSALTGHLLTHLPPEEKSMFSCCGKNFNSRSRLSTHVNTTHSNQSNASRREYQCDQCTKVFYCKSNLTYHQTTHKNLEFQVQCTECSKWLKNKICLRKHMATIHSETKHCCDMCDYSATNKQCLKSHKKVWHSDDKNFTCEVCSKSFKLKNTLMNHIFAQHNGLKRYTCEFCERAFFSSGNYYAHRKRMHPQELKSALDEKEREIQKKRQEILSQRALT